MTQEVKHMHAFDNGAAQRQTEQWKANLAAAKAVTPLASVPERPEDAADGEEG